MALSLIKKIKSGTIGVWELAESSLELCKSFVFAYQEKQEYSNLKIEKRKREYLAVRLLLDKMTNGKKQIQHNYEGKPAIKNYNLNISISHSANLAVILISEYNSGIDTERLDRNIEKAAIRFLPENELKNTLKADNPRHMQIIYWCAMEAVYKCISGQITDIRSQFRIVPFNHDANGGKFNGEVALSGKLLSFFFEYFYYKNNVIVWCVEDNRKK